MVGKKIAKYLREHGIKQGFVASKVGITDSKMSDICNGASIDCVLYYQICQVLGVPLETFLVEKDA